MNTPNSLTEPQGKLKKQNGTVALPPRMKAALEQYQKRVWTLKLAEGILAALFGLLVSYTVVFCLDRVWDTPALLRALILGVGMIGMIFLLPMKYYNWVWKHRQLDGVARLLHHKFPRFGDHVLGIVELARNRADQLSSPTLVEAAMRQVDAEVARHNLADAVPNPRHRRWAFAAALPLMLVVIGAVVIPATSWNTFARWLTPWRPVERYTFAQLEGESGLRVVPYAEAFRCGSTPERRFTVEAYVGRSSLCRPGPSGCDARRINVPISITPSNTGWTTHTSNRRCPTLYSYRTQIASGADPTYRCS